MASVNVRRLSVTFHRQVVVTSRSQLQKRIHSWLGKPAAKEAAGIVIAQAITVVAGIGIGALLARGLGVQGYGQYVFVLAIVQLMLVPLDFGLTTLVLREVAMLRAQRNWRMLAGLLRWSVAIIIVVLALLAVVVLFWQSFRSEDHDSLYLLAVTLAGLWALIRLASAALRGMERIVWAALPDQVIRPLIMLALVVVVPLSIELTPSRAIAFQAMAAAVALGVAVLFWVRWRPSGSAGPATYAPRIWTRSLLPLGLLVGAGLLHSRVDIFMLGLLVGSRELGIYGLAILISGVAVMPQTIVNTMIAPRFARLNVAGNRQHMEYIARRAALIAFSGGLAVLLGVIFLGNAVVVHFVGAEYSAAIDVAIITCSGAVIAAAFGSVTVVLNMSGNEQITARIVWLAVILNVVLNVALIPAFGAAGAATATAATTVITRTVLWLKVRQVVGISPDLFAFIPPRLIAHEDKEA